MSDLEHEQKHRRNDPDWSPHTRISTFDADDSDYDDADYPLHHGPGHHGARRGAVDFGREPRSDLNRPGAEDIDRNPCFDRPRRGAIDSGRPCEAFSVSGKGDDENFDGPLRMRRGSAADRDEFRGFLGSRGLRHRPVNSRFEEDLELNHPVHGEGYLPTRHEEYRHKCQKRGRPDHRPRHSDRVSHDVQGDSGEEFEPRALRRAAPLTHDRAHGTEERGHYVYYEPHAPRRDAGPRSARH